MVQDFFLFLSLIVIFSVEQNHYCNVEKGHYQEGLFEIRFEVGSLCYDLIS